MSVQQNLRGRPVYGNGSYAPNRGQVSANGAQGYIRREIAKQNKTVQQGPYSTQPVGRDGQSDRRSGVAQAAMGRPAPRTKAASVRANPSMGGTGGGRTASSAAPAAASAPASYTPNTTQMVVSPTGSLSISVNSQLAPDVASAYEEYLNNLNAQDEEDRQNALDYQENLRQANETYAGQQRSTLNNSASRGVAYSSAYSTAVERDSSDYNNGVNYLNQLNSNNQTNSNNRRALYQQAFDRRLAAITSQSAGMDAEDAAAWADAHAPEEPEAPTTRPPASGGGWNTGRPVAPKHPKPTPAPKPKPVPKPKPKGKK